MLIKNGQISIVLWQKVESHELNAAEVPVMSKQALDRAHAVAERRIALAGYRLAERLKFIISHDRYLTESATIADPSRRMTPRTR